MKNIGINTLVYMTELQAGVAQSSLLARIADQGIHLAQVRREYITDAQELTAIRDVARALNMTLYYSVPESIVIKDAPHPDFELFLQEAQTMGIVDAKFNQGDIDTASAETLALLDKLAAQYDVTLSIENDQTNKNGTMDCTRASLKNIADNASAIGYTFDLGNWFWQNGEPEQAFEELKNSITIFHIKNIQGSFAEQDLHTVMLEDGRINWKPMMSALGDDVPVFIEYPISDDQTISTEIALVQEAAK
ncbi:sugar phosphate isomerase/epimerase family protein [Alloscardovia criceti]|uniref:sugar phosphate isomerase/epimerase family protein n=1 Tax=Alloscardovia criceti TaxID=356828 RepID=UPI00036BCC42|nr:TIM barrel protein [Alloscardovia criceti]